MDGESMANIRIERFVYEHDQVREIGDYQKTKTNFVKDKCKCDDFSTKKCVLSTIPAIGWLSHYKWKRDIPSDLTSGFTVAVMHIPQGMAYALLGNVHPVVGIYMAFFPVLIYFFLGTSRHNSMGTFAVVCLMTGKAVLEHSHPSFFLKNSQTNNTTNPGVELIEYMHSPIEVATAVTFTVALFQLSMYILRLGAVSALLSETLVSGFTTGAAIHVLVSQFKDILGINIPRFKGYFVIINTLRSIFHAMSTVNFAAIIISTTTILITYVNNEFLKPFLAKKTSFPLPIELLAVVVGTLVSNYLNLEELYNIRTVGEIPSGLPVPSLPPLSLIGSVVLDGFTIAIVSYTITLSMALIFAQKLNYEVDANQELLAQGAGNIFGSFFSCMPFTASLSRSLIQQTTGGKTQIASVVSCMILLVVLLWIGPLFEPLPKSVLAGIIVVALKGMLMQVKEFFKFWRLSKMDAFIWIITFLVVVFIGIDIGLMAGVIVSLMNIFILNFKPYTCLLGSVPHTDLYLDVTKYKGTTQILGIKIFRYSGGLNFATKSLFKSDLLRLIEFDPQKEFIYRRKLLKYEQNAITKTQSSKINDEKMKKLQLKVNTDVKCLIFDFSSMSYCDPSAISMLKSIIESFQKIDIPVYVAACSDPVYEMMVKCEINTLKRQIRFFPTVHDAVYSACETFNLVSNLSIS